MRKFTVFLKLSGRSQSFIKKVRREGRLSDGEKLSTPGKKRPRPPAIIVDDMDRGIIRRKIQEFYDVKKEAPTIKKILACLRETTDSEDSMEGNFQKMSRETFRKIILQIGFKF